MNNFTILAVNDDSDQLELLAFILGKSDYRVLTAESGTEGLEIARRESPDLIISDVLMPEMNGVEFCRQIRADRPLRLTPFLLVSALCKDTKSVVDGLAAGADDYIEAPYEPLRLIAKVNQLIERKRMEDALRESQEYLEVAQQAARIGSFNFNFRSQLLTCSPSMESLYGASPNSLNGNLERWIKYIHAEDLPGVERELKQITLGDEYKSEFRILTDDGNLRWILSKGKIFFDDEGKPTRLVGVNIDITERKQTELILSFQKTLLEAQNEASIDGVLVVSPTGEVISYNQRFVEMWEIPGDLVATKSDEALLQSVLDKLVKPQEFLETISYLYQHPSIRNQIEISLKDGRVFERYSAPVTEGDTTHFGRIWSFRDITERKHAEEAVRHAEVRYRNLVELSPAIVYLAQPTPPYSTIYVSPNVELFGYSAEEWIERDDMWVNLIHEEDRERVLSETVNALSQSLETEIEYRILGRGGEIFWVHDKGCFISDAQGNKTGWQGVILDVTETKKLEERLRQSQKLESVGKLAGGIAHDFNNMLTAINGYSELTLRRLRPDDPLRDNIEEIKKAGERSAALTQQLLAFSRKQVLKPKVLNLNEVILDTSKMLNRLIGEHIHLELVSDSKLGMVEVDPGQLTQVIMNLAVNARDAMPFGGNLTIETSNVYLDEEYAENHFPTQVGSYVLIAVTDTGTGIDKDIKPHIFEPFYTTKKIGEGTGLGLATVYGIVKQSGGYIWVDSEIGEGASFKIYLPRIREIAESSVENKPREAIQTGRETILLVEDEDIVRRMSRQMLEAAGYQVFEAKNGIEALSICESQFGAIDLLLTDVVMPQMGGRELAEKLADKMPDIKILFTSGYTDDAIMRQGTIKEGKNFIQKPFTFEVLANKIRKLLDQKNLEDF